MLSNTNSDERDEYRPERCEARKVRHETRENTMETLEAQEIDRRDGGTRRGMLHRKSRQRGEPRHDDDDECQQREERRRMRQGVPAPLHDVQKSVEYRFTAHEGDLSRLGRRIQPCSAAITAPRNAAASSTMSFKGIMETHDDIRPLLLNRSTSGLSGTSGQILGSTPPPKYTPPRAA